MPYTKTIQIKTWKAYRKLYRYLQNRKHPNHAEYELTRMQSAHPQFAARQLRKEIEKTFARIGGEKRNGKPIENLYTLHISRMPSMGKKKNWLTPEERDEYARQYISTIAPDGLALYCWHVNRGNGEDDLNVLVANITDLERPRSRRRSDINHVDEARDTADMVTDVLNEKRRVQGRPHITTMPERLQQIDAEKRGTSLEDQLARHPQPVYLQNLRAVVEEYGHEITRYNEEKDFVSVRIKYPDEDPEKPGKLRARRFRLTALLGDVSRLRKQQQHAPEIAPQLTPEQMRAAEQASTFQLPRDKELDHLIAEYTSTQNRRAPEPPQEPPRAPDRSR
jgi:hypothetical protein